MACSHHWSCRAARQFLRTATHSEHQPCASNDPGPLHLLPPAHYVSPHVRTRATHGALPHRAPSTRCTAESMHHVWYRKSSGIDSFLGVKGGGEEEEGAAAGPAAGPPKPAPTPANERPAKSRKYKQKNKQSKDIPRGTANL